MDQICRNVTNISSLLRTQQLFLQICKNHNILVLLYQYIGYSAYVQLSATNSEVARALAQNEQVQMFILKLKVKKLKDRESTRQKFINFNTLGMTWLLFNPLAWPQCNNEAEETERLQDEKFQNQISKIETKKIIDNQFIKKREWKAEKNADILVALKLKRKTSKVKQPLKNVPQKKDVEYQQRMKIIMQSQKILQFNREYKKKLIEESRYAANQVQAIKNRHFVQQHLGKDYQKQLIQYYPRASQIPQKYSNTKYYYYRSRAAPNPSPSPSPTSPTLDLQFSRACTLDLKRHQARKFIEQVVKPSQKIRQDVIPIIPQDLGRVIKKVPFLGDLLRGRTRDRWDY